MALIKSISGIRGTIGGQPGDGLTPQDIVKFSSAFGTWLRSQSDSRKVVIGRDARISGEVVSNLVSGTLLSLGFDVIDLGLSTTPTVEVAVPAELAAGGIIITASHNPKQWNALKLLNHRGEFISAQDGSQVLELAESDRIDYCEVTDLGEYSTNTDHLQKHIEAIVNLPLVDVEVIRASGFKVAVDAVNSTGGIAVPKLLNALGVTAVTRLHCEPTGHFAHNPEPLPENLTELSDLLRDGDHDLGIVVDPDVDRLALLCEDGSFFGEEYTLVAVADYVLQNQPGNTVSNLSSTRALRDITEKHGGQYSASAVGEVNVVEKMKETSAIIGGEGNGGVIYPESHYGRDALVGIALFLTHLAKSKKTASELRALYPNYYISKNKIDLTPQIDIDHLLDSVAVNHSTDNVSTIDGVKIDTEEGWVHLRKSNTEPIIRVYAESSSLEAATRLAQQIIDEINSITSQKA